MTFLKAGLRVTAVAAAFLALAACSSTPDEDASAASNPSSVSSETAPGGATPGTQQDLVVNVGDRVFFDLDRSDIKPEARQTLQRQAAWLKQYPALTVTIEGHADERGTREYNLALGGRRANAVKDYLVAQGVDPARVRTISYGKERPVALCSDESCWSQNRRGVTVVNDRAGS
ncbi:peptidoglycan-associated lipoprotein [Tepidicaulis marinus]|jgi:peptidoglycan-associated lipoprotein|uniref:Peptidoglycan-associated lipoprotein n=1 Tax=Tepidicaulis marinus TaxID=1333998 RepID=A0A081BET9_9HYPH|nr:peptidoglycan-associated lipoprotein Pal [Tepidicaulis marinus]GAK46557.1 peptidoglycan-associated lipoprotein [Tepidicaulis marinus]